MINDAYSEILMFLPPSLQASLRNVPSHVARRVNEIRLRSERPISLICSRETFFPDKFGTCFKTVSNQLPRVAQKELEETVYLLCQSSVYCHQEELKQGFVSLPGGHRAGVCGTFVLRGSEVESVKDISSVNIRIARQVKDCSAKITRRDIIGGLVIAGPPGSGKTTLLRDIIRRCAAGYFGEFIRVAAADERGELSAMCMGSPGLDVGLADVICGIDKSHAVMMAVRTLNPQIVAFDEIGSDEDAAAVAAAAAAGVDYIATIHCDSLDRLLSNPLFDRLRPYTANAVILGDAPGQIIGAYRLGELENETVGSACDGDNGGISGHLFCPQTAV